MSIQSVTPPACECPMCKLGPTLLPCPFCGSADIDPEGWASTDRAGPACNNCSGSADTVELWNSRPASHVEGARCND